MAEHLMELGEFALHLLHRVEELYEFQQRGLERACHLIAEDAKAQLGEYQNAIGPFVEWAPLTEETQAQRVRLGFSADEPLLRTGELRDSISYEVHGLEGVVGSTSMIALYQELGTSRGIPPRPFLGPAAFRNKERVEQIIGMATVAGIVGGNANLLSFHGYDFDIGER